MDLKEFFLKQKQSVRERTREVLALVRPEHLDWRPEAQALSIQEMLQHMATSEEGVRRAAIEGNLAYYEKRIPKGLRATLKDDRSLGELLQDLERVHSETLAAVSNFPSERFGEERIHEALGFRRKVVVMLMGINEHEIHHRAQLMTYLRMLGTPAPDAVKPRRT